MIDYAKASYVLHSVAYDIIQFQGIIAYLSFNLFEYRYNSMMIGSHCCNL